MMTLMKMAQTKHDAGAKRGVVAIGILLDRALKPSTRNVRHVMPCILPT
jgi:hypothetical protein